SPSFCGLRRNLPTRAGLAKPSVVKNESPRPASEFYGSALLAARGTDALNDGTLLKGDFHASHLSTPSSLLRTRYFSFLTHCKVSLGSHSSSPRGISASRFSGGFGRRCAARPVALRPWLEVPAWPQQR